MTNQIKNARRNNNAVLNPELIIQKDSETLSLMIDCASALKAGLYNRPFQV
jgi:hypothetical protein